MPRVPSRRAPLALALAALLLAPAVVARTTAPTEEAIGEEGAWGAGPYRYASKPYFLGHTFVTNGATHVPYVVRLAGTVYYPEGAAGGPFPLVVLMHGMHETCHVGQQELVGLSRLCPTTRTSGRIESHRGYDYLATHLASHGFVVASVDASDVNDFDVFRDYAVQERAQLALRTVERFAEANETSLATLGMALVGRIDASRVGLMGHSRGGEGVVRAVTYQQERGLAQGARIRAVFALAPTDLGRWSVPGVAFATLVPYCDGDVRELKGTWVYDESRYLADDGAGSLVQVVAMGANHNWFNTEWPEDDASWHATVTTDPHCGAASGARPLGAGRLSMEDQRRMGLVYMAGFFRHHLAAEAPLGAWLANAAPPPDAACPGGVGPCPERVHVSRHAATGDRRVVEDAREGEVPSVNDLGGVSAFDGFASVSACTPPACSVPGTIGLAPRLTLAWEGPATYRNALPGGAGNLSAFTEVSFRAGVTHGDVRNPAGRLQDLRVVLTDGDGRSVSATVSEWSPHALQYPPGLGARKVILNAVSVPLAAFEGLDLSDVRSVDLVFDRTPAGVLQVADLLFSR